jgi:two-component system, cell cycle sensor histidine kinase and response regulator CckA
VALNCELRPHLTLTTFRVGLAGTVFALYLLAALVGEHLSLTSYPFVGFWLPSGVYLGFLLTSPRQRWSYIVSAAVCANLTFDLYHGRSVADALAFASANSAEALTGAWLLRRVIGDRSPLSGEREFGLFVALSSILSTGISATLGIIWLIVSSNLADPAHMWWRWWLSDLIGVLLVAPAVIAWREPVASAPRRSSSFEILAIVVIGAVTLWFAVIGAPPGGTSRRFLLLPFLVWAALRLSVRTIVLLNLGVALGGSWPFFHGLRLRPELFPQLADDAVLSQLSFAFGACVGVVVAIIFRENRRTSLALGESEERYRRLFETETDAILMVERDSGRILDANTAATRLYGYTHAEFCTLAFRNIFSDPHASQPSMSTGIAYIPVAHHRKKDGTAIAVEIAASYFENANRRIQVAAIRDITARKRAELELRKLSRAIEQSPMVVTITDAKGAIEYVNPSFTTTTGYTFAEVRGKNPRILKSGEQSDAFYRDLWSTISDGKEWRGEFHNRKKNGELFWESAIISPITDDSGHVTHYLALKQDITAHRRLEMQFRHMQKMEAVGQLAGGIAHDFNNILAATTLHLNLLQKEPQLTPRLRASLLELEMETRRATALTRQLLLFSRKQLLRPETVDLNEVVLNLIKMLRRLIGENIRLVFPGVGAPLWVEADPSMIEQVIMNLCVNARDAMPDGGSLSIETGIVEIDAATSALNPEARAGRMARIDISDTGHGMDATTLKRLFEPFFTTKDVGKGTGLGLATAYGIIRQHRGWITVESEAGKGSTFHVFIPALADSFVPAADAPTADTLGGAESILLVEDDQEMRRVTALTLESFGYNVIQAANGKQALQSWSNHNSEIDLLLTDMMMPDGLSGLKIAEQLRVLRPSLPVLIISGYSAILSRENDLAKMGIDYLAKPFRADALGAALRTCLDRHSHGP